MANDLTLGGSVFADQNNNQLFDPGEGYGGVTVSLFDSDNATLLASTFTSSTGSYAFSGLAPGDYFVRLNAVNFNPGGPLRDYNSLAAEGDPDDDVDNDDNGIETNGLLGLGGYVTSAAITLADNGEPVNDGDADADTNLTLDFGLIHYIVPQIANLTGDILTFAEGAAPTRLDQATAASLDVSSDVIHDGDKLSVAIVSGRNTAEDVLSIIDGNGITVAGSTVSYNGQAIGSVAGGTGSSSLVVTLNGADPSPDSVSALLGQIAYQNTNAADPDGADRIVRVTFNNGVTVSKNNDVTVHVAAQNDAPVITVPGAPAQVTDEDAALRFNAANGNSITLADVDAGTGDETLTLTVVSGALTLATTAGLTTVTGNGTATVTLTGTVAEINAALDGLAYAPDQNYNGHDTLTITADDNGNTGAPGARTATGLVPITVNAVNDAPVNTVPGTQEVEANTGTAIAGLSITDVDADAGALTATLAVAHGTLTVVAAGGVMVAGSSTGTVTLTGTPAQINATLAAAGHVLYRGLPDFFGTDTLTITTNDGGKTGAGGALDDADTVTIHVNTVITGTPGADHYDAPPGNVRIDALGGSDTITFDFALVDATVSYAGNSVIIDGPSSSHTVLTGFERFLFTDGTVSNDDGSYLVDDLFYYARNHDVWTTGVDADAHYAMFGWHEGRDPNAFFSTSTYLSANPDVKAAGVNPLDHWHTAGWAEGRVPSIDFDPRQYLSANLDVAAAHVDPLEHFLHLGAQEGRKPFAPGELPAANGFDYVYYLQHNPDVAAAHVDPLLHFQAIGWSEGRDPNALFDVSGYLATYGDVAAAGINPLDHYDTFGRHEGRDPSVGFDTTAYLAAYSDVAAAGVNPLAHFLHFGIHEGRSAFADGVWG